MTQYDLITFGETMLRLSPPGINRLEDTATLEVQVGGAESNVAANLARLGKKSAWFSRLPDTPLGYTIRNGIRHHGVDTSHIIWADNQRLGLYFIEYGAAPRSTQVWYDRANSASSHLGSDDLPREAIAHSRWLHLTGITAALGSTCADAINMAMFIAGQNNVQISFDVNYRAMLWDEKSAATTMTPMCETADVVFVALRDAVNLFGAPDTMLDCARHLQEQWGGTIIVSDGDKGVTAVDATQQATAPTIQTQIIDRIGAGDAMASGIICQLLEKAPLEKALHFGTVMAAFALSIPGDIARVSRAEIDARLNQGDGGSLRR